MPRKSTPAKATAAAEVKKEAAVEVKATAKAPAAEKKTPAPKKETAKSAVKEAAKVPAAEPKKAPARKAAGKAEPSTSVFFEYDGVQIVAKDLLARAMKEFKEAHKDVEMKDVQLYVNGNERFAYIVVNGVEYPEDRIAL